MKRPFGDDPLFVFLRFTLALLNLQVAFPHFLWQVANITRLATLQSPQRGFRALRAQSWKRSWK